MEIVVEKNEGLRIDKYLSFEIEELSRNKIQKLLENGHILVNQKSVNNNYKVTYVVDFDEISNDDLTKFNLDRDFTTLKTSYINQGFTCK